MKTTDFLNYNLNRKIFIEDKTYIIDKDSDGFFTIKNDGNIVLILNDDQFDGENKDLAEKVNRAIFSKQLMELTGKIIENQGKMIKFLMK